MFAVGHHGCFVQLFAGMGRTAPMVCLALGVAGCATPWPEAPNIPGRPNEPDLGHVHLVGLGGADLEGLLGRPVLLRSERQAQYWRYTLGSCQLDLFLYAEHDAGPVRVVYFDVRPAGHASPERIATCARLRSALRGEPQTPSPGVRAQNVALPADGAY